MPLSPAALAAIEAAGTAAGGPLAGWAASVAAQLGTSYLEQHSGRPIEAMTREEINAAAVAVDIEHASDAFDRGAAGAEGSE